MGFGEILLIVFLVLLFFGAGKLPAIGEGLGKAIRGLKDAVSPGPERPAPPAERPAPAEPPAKRELPPRP